MVKYSCKELANIVKDAVKSSLIHFKKPPVLNIISNGSPAGERYIKNKIKVAEEVGIETRVHVLDPGLHSVANLSYFIRSIKEGSIIVQLPFYGDWRDEDIIESIPSLQDVDGLTKDTLVTPATALGIFNFLEWNELIYKKNIVIIGRSKLVGLPLAHKLLTKPCTVTVCNSYTKDLREHTQNADVIVCAVGKQNLITTAHLSDDKHQTIIDVGININQEGKLCGDVAPAVSTCNELAYVTPVPGGVGLLTTAYLMKNVVELHKKKLNCMWS